MTLRLRCLLGLLPLLCGATIAFAQDGVVEEAPQTGAPSDEEEWVEEEEPVQDLDELKLLPEYKHLVRKQGRLKLPSQIDPDSNYAQLMEGGGSKATVFKALGHDIEGFFSTSTYTKRKHNHLLATRVFHTSDRVKIALNVILPHPAFVQMAAEGIEFDLPEYEPESGSVASRDTIEVDDQTGELLHLKDGSVRVYLRLPKRVTLILKTQRARDSKTLLRLLDNLSISELKRHINS